MKKPQKDAVGEAAIHPNPSSFRYKNASTTESRFPETMVIEGQAGIYALGLGRTSPCSGPHGPDSAPRHPQRRSLDQCPFLPISLTGTFPGKQVGNPALCDSTNQPASRATNEQTLLCNLCKLNILQANLVSQEEPGPSREWRY